MGTDTDDDTENPGAELHLEEVRRTIDRQYEILYEIDDRSLRLVRTALILLGIFFTGVNIAPAAVLRSLGAVVFWSGVIGGGLLVLTVLFGVATLQLNSPVYGTETIQRGALWGSATRSEAVLELVGEYELQANAMKQEIARGQAALWVLQMLMIGAVLAFTVATGFIVWRL